MKDITELRKEYEQTHNEYLEWNKQRMIRMAVRYSIYTAGILCIYYAMRITSGFSEFIEYFNGPWEPKTLIKAILTSRWIDVLMVPIWIAIGIWLFYGDYIKSCDSDHIPAIGVLTGVLTAVFTWNGFIMYGISLVICMIASFWVYRTQMLFFAWTYSLTMGLIISPLTGLMMGMGAAILGGLSSTLIILIIRGTIAAPRWTLDTVSKGVKLLKPSHAT